MSAFPHKFSFDPAYGYSLDSLLQVSAPAEPEDFSVFWENRYARAMEVLPFPEIHRHTSAHSEFEVFDVIYHSTDEFVIGGWLVAPKHGPVTRGVVVGHGYGGREQPDFDLPIAEAAFLFPCFRGISRSRRSPISENPVWHVLHDIDKADRYILGGCVDDLWLAVSALLALYPQTAGHIGYLGVSFGGGIGALALPWDARINLAHLNVPTFGHHPLRLTLPTVGSGAAIRLYQNRHGNVLETLRYYDAACAARHVRIPVLVAAALFDPVVAPPGQFAIYNALPGAKSLYVLQAGHFDYPDKPAEEGELKELLGTFFATL